MSPSQEIEVQLSSSARRRLRHQQLNCSFDGASLLLRLEKLEREMQQMRSDRSVSEPDSEPERELSVTRDAFLQLRPRVDAPHVHCSGHSVFKDGESSADIFVGSAAQPFVGEHTAISDSVVKLDALLHELQDKLYSPWEVPAAGDQLINDVVIADFGACPYVTETEPPCHDKSEFEPDCLFDAPVFENHYLFSCGRAKSTYRATSDSSLRALASDLTQLSNLLADFHEISCMPPSSFSSWLERYGEYPPYYQDSDDDASLDDASFDEMCQ